jgi:hypothetical protein
MRRNEEKEGGEEEEEIRVEGARGEEKADRGTAEDRIGGQRARSMGWGGGGAGEIEAGMGFLQATR